jgi:hypothetical protein
VALASLSATGAATSGVAGASTGSGSITLGALGVAGVANGGGPPPFAGLDAYPDPFGATSITAPFGPDPFVASSRLRGS